MTADPKAIGVAIDLLDKYTDEDEDPEDFLRGKFAEMAIDDSEMVTISELFFKTLKYRRLFDVILDDYNRSRIRHLSRTYQDRSLYSVFLYYSLMELNEETVDWVKKLLTAVNAKKALALTGYLRKSNFLSKLFKWAASIWDIDYVRNLLNGLVHHPVLQTLHNAIREEAEERKTCIKKEPTKPMDLQVLKRTKKTAKMDCYSTKELERTSSMPNVPIKVKPTPIPRTTYAKPKYEKRLEETKAKHQEKAKKLYEEAQKSSFRVANLPRATKALEQPKIEVDAPKTRRIDINKEPSIQPKKTAAVILREGARLMKIEEDEIKRLEDIMRGAFNSESLKALEREILEERSRNEMEEIEKKHLRGLLTYEEALIAKQKYLKRMKEGADELRKEKEIWVKQLEDWKMKEKIRIQESVEKGKSYEKGAKGAVEHVREEKHKMVLETIEKSRFLREQWLAEREKELQRKIQIINEIKALQAFGLVRRKEALANASASIGSLCEMSMEELRERLTILKMELTEEIERRRGEIRQRKKCRQAIVDGYRDLIVQHREIRNWKLEKAKLEQSEMKAKSTARPSSVEALRKKLADKRRERLEHENR